MGGGGEYTTSMSSELIDGEGIGGSMWVHAASPVR